MNGATGEPIPPADDETIVIVTEPHQHRASCYGAIGELQCGYDEPRDTGDKVNKLGPIIATAVCFALVLGLVGSLAIWAIVEIWKAILS